MHGPWPHSPLGGHSSAHEMPSSELQYLLLKYECSLGYGTSVYEQSQAHSQGVGCSSALYRVHHPVW
jgi:hypothetical protein